MAMMPSPGRPPKLPIPTPEAIPAAGHDAERLRLWSEPGSAPGGSSAASGLEAALEEFTRRWDRGEAPRAEDFLDRLPPGDPDGPLELIYHEFCLLASSARRPAPESFAGRFPTYRDRLLRLIALHDALPSVGGDSAEAIALPEVGDQIGPFRLLRELGRGGFARVYLAADADLEDRLVVVKVTDRPSAEHRYLARAPHPHIVPILRERTTEDGLQLIFMPFVGGGTLADVLAEARARPRRPDRGADLLADLDLRSAPEYAAASPGRPAREIIASLGYPQAIAWLVARLAEALDHAYRRGVTHGDLKPSNILLGGDGQPMLLDFNLSTDWRPAGPSTASGEPGGTLAYMAPERLRALAEPELASPPCPAARHRADLYALGLILREAITGHPPHVPCSSDDSPRSGRALAALLAAERSAGDPSSRSSLASIPPGLRVILRRCLAPDPSDRYPLACHLAADLDRWRAGLALAHATPPRWLEVTRWARRRRAPLVAAVVCIALGTLCTAATSRVQDEISSRDELVSNLKNRIISKDEGLVANASRKVASFWTDTDSPAYDYWVFAPWRGPDRPRQFESSERPLRAYGLFDDSDAWRHPEVAVLPEPVRSDLRAWLLERSFLHALTLSRSDFDPFPEERRRALDLLERAASAWELEPIDRLVTRLRTRLDLPQKTTESPRGLAPRWLLSYLNGVLAESVLPGDAEDLGIDPSASGIDVAMGHYRATLIERPDLYWPRFRLGACASRVGDFATALAAYDACLEQRPDCAPLWVGKGTCQIYLGVPERAEDSYRKAMDLAPRWIPACRELALLGARLGHDDLTRQAITRHRALSRPVGSNAHLELQKWVNAVGFAPDMVPFGPDETDIDLRLEVAVRLHERGRLDEALTEYDRIIGEEPSLLLARYNRAIVLQQAGRKPEAVAAYRGVAEHSDYASFVNYYPDAVASRLILSADDARNGRIDEAIRQANLAVEEASATGSGLGEAYYALARAHASATGIDPTRIGKAARALDAARLQHPGFVDDRLRSDPLMAGHLAELAALLGDVEF